MEIRRAQLSDLDRIMVVFGIAQDLMIERGNPTQWAHRYPTRGLIEADIAKEIAYVIENQDIVVGYFSLMSGDDPTYAYIEDGSWLNGDPYLTIHRIAGDGTVHGLFHLASDFSKDRCDNVRVDTHRDNGVMQRAILKEGFEYCGIIYQPDGSRRLAYQWKKVK